MVTDKITTNYHDNGFVLLKKVIVTKQIISLITELKSFNEGVNYYGIRDLMGKVPGIFELARSKSLLQIAQSLLGEKAKPIRSVFFDKMPQANWNVAWHQDTSIAVSEKAEIEGFKLWTIKQGIVYVEPPETYLANILTLRLHLDAANTENGVLRVIPESHKNGRINAAKIAVLIKNNRAITCDANAGDVLLMNPLLLHASHKAIIASHRRIIHLEYSAMDLPEPLSWHETYNN